MQYTTWYDEWLSRIDGWTMDCSVGETANVLLMIPDLVKALISLSSDARVPAEVAAVMQKTANNTMRGIEYLPPGFSGVVGLLQDAQHIAAALDPLLPQVDRAVLAEHWQNQKYDLPATVRYLLEDSDSYSPQC